MGIAAPLSEELLFRGIIFERLRMAPHFLGGTWVGGIFRVGAWNWAQGIYAALMGLILAWLYEKRTVCGNLCYFTVQQI